MPIPLVVPDIEDEGLLARYPFLPQSEAFLKELLEENNITIEDLIDAPWLEDIRIKARVRLIDSIVQKNSMGISYSLDVSTEIGRMMEFLSFLHSMLVVCASFDERLLARWVEGEASRADQLMGLEESSFSLISSTYLSSIDLRESETGEPEYWVPLSDFIELSPKISGKYWRLVNRPVSNGWVCLNSGFGESSSGRTSRLIKERIRQQLYNNCVERMARMDDEFASKFTESVEKIMGLMSEQVEAEMPVNAALREDWPPCFESAISELNQGINVNHAGRVFLAAFSRSIGIPQEQTCSFFSNAPDYESDTTSYQVNQIYEREYTPHGCSSLKTNARCPVQVGDDSLCDQEWMDHPLKYIRIKQKGRFVMSSQDIEKETSEVHNLGDDS